MHLSFELDVCNESLSSIPATCEADVRYPTIARRRRSPGRRSIVTRQNSPSFGVHPCSSRLEGSSYSMAGVDTAAQHAALDAPAFVAPRNLLARPMLPAADKEQIESLVRLRPRRGETDAR